MITNTYHEKSGDLPVTLSPFFTFPAAADSSNL